MGDFYIINIDPRTKGVLDKFTLNSKNVMVFPEDTFLDLKYKIWIAYDIPPYRQFLYTSDGYIMFDLYVNNILIPVNIIEWFNKKDLDVILAGIPINKYLTENKESIKINHSKQYKMIDKTKQVFMVDLNNILSKDVIYESNIINESYKLDIMYYGFIIMFWPHLTHMLFKTYLKKPNEIMDYTMDEIKSVVKKEQKIVKDIHDKKKLLGTSSVSMLDQILQVDLGVRSINIRNIADWFGTNSNMPVIIAYYIEDLEGKILVKKHASTDDIVNKIINRKSLLKITKNTIPNVSFIFKRSENNFIIFSITENGIDSNIYVDYNEDEHINIDKNIDYIISFTKPIINKINNELHISALPQGGKITYLSKDSIIKHDLHICFYWKKSVSLKTFINMKEQMKEFQYAGILEILQEECSHNDYHYDNCFLIMFKKGMLSEEGREVKIQLRTTDIRIEIFKAKDIQEVHIIQKYLLYFFNEQKILKETATDLVKYTLKTLHEKDPVLYDIKRYDRNAKVYSVLCQSTRQPILYTEEEFDGLPATKKKAITKYWNFTYQKPAYYECPNKNFPHLSFKINKHPKNYCLPCCKKTQTEISELEQKCFDDHVVDTVVSDSNYVLTYGKPIPVGRISKINHDLLFRLKELSKTCTECNYVLYGVEQNIPAVNNVGLIMSILSSIAIDTTIEQLLLDISKKVISYGSTYHLIGNGAAQVFDSPEHLADTIINIFVNKTNDFVLLDDPEEWNKIFISLAKDLYNVEVAIWEDVSDRSGISGNGDIKHTSRLVLSTDFVFEEDTKILLVITNKNGSYPLYVTDGDETSGQAVYTSMLGTKNISVEAVYTLINNMSSNVVDNQGISQLCLLDTIFIHLDEWTPEIKLVDSRNLCYGIIASKSNEYVYIPVLYSTTGKYLKNIPISHETKPDYSYKQSTLREFINDINTIIDTNKNICNSKKIIPTHLIQNYDDKYIGFQVGKLFYFHDPDSMPFDLSITKIKKMLYNPADIDKSIMNYKIDLTPTHGTSTYDDIIRSEYRNRLYKLFISEFAYYVLQERNKNIRSKINRLINKTNFDSAIEIDNLFICLDKLTDDLNKQLSYEDRSYIKKLISDVRDPVKIKIAIDNSIFEFDQTILSELKKLELSETEYKVKKIMSSLVVLVDESTINADSKISNIFLPCQSDRKNMNLHCKNKKLKMINTLFDDYIKILSADIHNISVLDVSNVFDTTEFIKHPGETITLYKK